MFLYKMWNDIDESYYNRHRHEECWLPVRLGGKCYMLCHGSLLFFSLFKLTFSEFFPYSLLVFHNLYDGNLINYTNVDNGLETTAHCTIFVFKLLKYKTVGFKILKFIDYSVISTSLFTVS